MVSPGHRRCDRRCRRRSGCRHCIFRRGFLPAAKSAEAKIGSAEEEAKRLINDAMKAAQQKRKEALIEAKDEAFQLKAEADKEIKERRSELSRQERRLDPKGRGHGPQNGRSGAERN